MTKISRMCTALGGIIAAGMIVLLITGCHAAQTVTYTVTYDGNGNTGGNVPADNNTYGEGAAVTVLGNTGQLVKTGYSFVGWNTAADTTGTGYTEGETFVMGNEDVVLYAAWSDGSPSNPVTGLTLNRTSLTLEPGSAVQLTAAITPPDAANPAISWASDAPDIASVDQDGLVTAAAEGTADITAGSAENPDVFDTCTVTVRVPSWGTAVLIETENAGNAENAQVAVDEDGNAIAVWGQDDGSRYNIRANRYTPSGGWGTAELIETDDGRARYLQIAVDEDGNAVAVWQQFDGSRDNIWANRYSPAGGWGSGELIETDNAGGASEPQIEVDAAGNAIAVWYQYDGTRNNIWANRYTPTEGWGTTELIETDNGNIGNPQVAVDDMGNAIAVWPQHDGVRYNIRANRYTPSGGWGTAEHIETDDAGNAENPQVAVDENGNAIAVWHQSDGTRNNIWANRYTPSGGWGTAELLETDDAGGAWEPQIAVDVAGNAIAVWTQFDGIRYNIRANNYSPGAGWGTAFPIEADEENSAQNPQIAVNGGGDALAVWRNHNGISWVIWASRYTAGSWGAPTRIGNEVGGHSTQPQIGINTAGNGVAVWQQNDGTRSDIWANSFE